MSYNILDIEGIGPTYAEKLKAVGIKTTDDLLEMGGTKKGHEKISASTSIPESLTLTWVKHSDLFRIKGIASQFSELLEGAGVNTVREFAQRNAENLHAKLTETNEKFGLSGRVPSVDKLKEMIEIAKTLEAKVSH